jgi:hypothetical protein
MLAWQILECRVSHLWQETDLLELFKKNSLQIVSLSYTSLNWSANIYVCEEPFHLLNNIQ